MSHRSVGLEWQGKSLAREALRSPVPPILVDEELAPAHLGDHVPRRIVAGDALDVARGLEAVGGAGCFDLIYLDPPYGSGVDYQHEQRMDGPANGRVATAAAYRDTWGEGPAAYLDMLYPRLLAMRPLLKATGSLWVQVDWRANYLVRMLCDEVFGRERFLNEIIWRRSPNLGRQARSSQFGRTLDSIIVYGASDATKLVPPTRLVPVTRAAARCDPESGRFFTLAPRGDYTDLSIARLQAEGRVHRSASGTVSIRYWLERDDEGVLCRRQPVDALWVDIAPLRHASPQERTGYPTQKPQALLARIISAATPPGGWVLDLFAGSGTTAVAAAALGRGFVVGDASPVALVTMRSRLLRAGAPSLTLERCGSALPSARCTVTACDRGDGTVELRLFDEEEEEDRAVAWAVGSCEAGAGCADAEPFRALWHAERGTGRSPAPMPMSVVLPRSAQYVARVYFVSGRRGETWCEPQLAARGERAKEAATASGARPMRRWEESS